MSADLYPRKDFERSSLQWQSLNGTWKFSFDDEDVGLSGQWHRNGISSGKAKGKGHQTIEVPFVFQSQASGIDDQSAHEVIWYERHIHDIRTDAQKRGGQRLIIRFGAVDYITKVWLDGIPVGEHRGGHVPFDLDVTDAASDHKDPEHNFRLVIRVYDSAYDLTQPRGKQFWGPKPRTIYYTPSSGIWQNVWLESVPRLRIAESNYGTILRSNDIEGGRLDASIAVIGRRVGEKCSIELEARLSDVVVSTSGRKQLPRDQDFVRFDHDMRVSKDKLEQLPDTLVSSTDSWHGRVAVWSPEAPVLYELVLRLYDEDGKLLDEICTTTGMRSVNWTKGNGTLLLNGKPYFQALLLDQGYWPQTLMTPPDSQALRTDIELAKAMGFNGCRKHQKVEDPMFMYWADRLGFLVWGEMASAFQFSVDMTERFDQEWMEMVKRDINHPCIVAWTPANESWGYRDLQNDTRQRDHLRSLYYMTKALDPTRPINENCGWEHVLSDLSTFHDYSDAEGMGERCESITSVTRIPLAAFRDMFVKPIYKADGTYDPGSQHKSGAPILCTEFGGVNISSSRGESEQENWGYTTAQDSDDLLKRVEDIIISTVKSRVVSGFVWTQLTDIQQEQNGLYTWQRKQKLPAEKMKAILDAVKQDYNGSWS